MGSGNACEACTLSALGAKHHPRTALQFALTLIFSISQATSPQDTQSSRLPPWCGSDGTLGAAWSSGLTIADSGENPTEAVLAHAFGNFPVSHLSNASRSDSTSGTNRPVSGTSTTSAPKAPSENLSSSTSSILCSAG